MSLNRHWTGPDRPETGLRGGREELVILTVGPDESSVLSGYDEGIKKEGRKKKKKNYRRSCSNLVKV